MGSKYTDPFKKQFVANFHRFQLFAKPEEFITFNHPNGGGSESFNRFKTLTWNSLQEGSIHGFAGYFKSILYGPVEIDILPRRRSDPNTMVSWYPFFIPLKKPEEVKVNDPIELTIWRKNCDGHVWYEWKTKEQDVHNRNGHSYKMSLSIINLIRLNYCYFN